jgi:hypothetical protein
MSNIGNRLIELEDSFKNIHMELEDSLILEFANIGPSIHEFGVNVNLHLMQPDDQKLVHGPRIKVYTGSWKTGPNFTITLEETPRVIGKSSEIVNGKELNLLLQQVKKHRLAFIEFWNDSSMTVDRLKELMREI